MSGGWIIRTEEPVGEYGEQVLALTIGSAVTFASIGYLITLGMAVERTAFAVPISVLQAFTVGSLAGILVGVYDARSRNRFDDLQRERNRAERFARKAKSLNTYGKALNQSRDVHDVSALGVEVLELLIESSESAVVVVTDDSTTVLEATMTGELGEVIETIATDIAASPEMETVRCPNDVDCSIPESVPVREVLGVPIDAGEATVVLLALTRATDVYRRRSRSARIVVRSRRDGLPEFGTRRGCSFRLSTELLVLGDFHTRKAEPNASRIVSDEAHSPPVCVGDSLHDH